MKSKEDLISQKMAGVEMDLEDVLGETPVTVENMRKDQRKVLDTGGSIWIHGKPGMGKTAIAHFMALKRYRDGLIVAGNRYQVVGKEPRPLPFMSYMLCREFQRESLEGRDYEPKNFFYIIDDIDKIKMTDFREEQFFIFFDRCLKLKRKLIVTSQKSMKEFSQMFSGNFIGALNRRLEAIFTEVEL